LVEALTVPLVGSAVQPVDAQGCAVRFRSPPKLFPGRGFVAETAHTVDVVH
jgi:hypothetical protein